VAIGISSQVGRNAARTTHDVVDALAEARVRAVLVTGFGGLKGVELPSTIHAVPAVAYDWLLPRVSALVHHGGAGSTALALRAGVPSVTTYFGFDQKLWGERVHALGAGPAPLAADRLTADSLAEAIRAVTATDSMRIRAREVAGILAKEDGVKTAVGLILEAAGR
jgi:sterol 3beta-glucosyltransferase